MLGRIGNQQRTFGNASSRSYCIINGIVESFWVQSLQFTLVPFHCFRLFGKEHEIQSIVQFKSDLSKRTEIQETNKHIFLKREFGFGRKGLREVLMYLSSSSIFFYLKLLETLRGEKPAGLCLLMFYSFGLIFLFLFYFIFNAVSALLYRIINGYN